jgi:hypothetical protein
MRMHLKTRAQKQKGNANPIRGCAKLSGKW